MLSFTSRKPLSPTEPFVASRFQLITTGTFQKRPFIRGDDRKAMLLESLDFNAYKWNWRMVAYTILDNHYHLILQAPVDDYSRLAHIIQSAHSFSAHHWRLEDPTIRSRIWWNFWEAAIPSAADLHRLINYIHYNCKFHGLCDRPEQYRFSSYADYLQQDAATLHAWEREFPASEVSLIDSF